MHVGCHFSKHLAENVNKVGGYRFSEALSMKQAKLRLSLQASLCRLSPQKTVKLI